MTKWDRVEGHALATRRDDVSEALGSIKSEPTGFEAEAAAEIARPVGYPVPSTSTQQPVVTGLASRTPDGSAEVVTVTAEGTVDEAPDKAVGCTAKTRAHLAAIDRLRSSPDTLLQHRLIGPDARFTVPKAAKLAKVPVSSAYREPVLAHLRALADVRWQEQTERVADAACDQGTSLRPTIDPIDTEAWLEAAAAKEAGLGPAELEACLDLLDDWDQELGGSTDAVPSIGRRPAKGAIARRFGLHPHLLEHPAADAMLLGLARRHGVKSARGGPRHASDRNATALAAVTDRMNSLALRNEAFDADASGLPLLGKLITVLGLDPEVAYRHRFRMHVAECQRILLGSEALPSGEALYVALSNAVIDIYEREVDAGIAIPPLTIQGTLRLEALERKLNLVAGTSRRHPEIGERLHGIASRYIDDLKEERTAERQAARAAYIVSRIEALGIEMAGRAKAPVNSAGGVSMAALSVALGLQFKEYGTHPLVEAAIAAFVAKVGLMEKRSPPRPPRSQQDDDVDDLCRRIRQRGFGPPRGQLCTTCTTREGAASELRIDPRSLTDSQIIRIRTASRAVRGFNPSVVETEPFPYELNSPDRSDLLQTLLADPIFGAGLPGHPLDPRKLDWNALSIVLGMSSLYLRQNRSARELLDAKMLAVGIAPHPGDRSDITFGELRAFGRRRRTEQAIREAERGDAAEQAEGATPKEDGAIDGVGPETVQAASIAARSVRALEGFLKSEGYSLSDTIGLKLLKARPGEAIDAAELTRWRLFQAELAAERPCHPFDLPFGAADWVRRKMPLGSALTLLCRAKGVSKAEIGRNLGGTRLAEAWCNGFSVPSWPDEPTLERLNDFFDLAPGTLTGLLNGDRRPLGTVPGERIRRTAVSCHLPTGFAGLERQDRRAALKRAQACAVQDTAYAKRQRVLNQDEYILRIDRWPAHLKAEWTLFKKRRRSKVKRPEGGLDIFDTIKEDFANTAAQVATGTENRELATFERFFGFLVLASRRGDVPLIDPRTRADELAFHEENLRAVGYVPRGGLGIKPESLTMAAAAIPGLVRAFLAFLHHRSAGYSRGTISEVKHLIAAVKVGSPLRKSKAAGKAKKQLLASLRSKHPGGCPGYERETVALEDATWDGAAQTYTDIYLNLFRFRAQCNGPLRDRVPEELRVETKRISFDPVMVVLRSKTPAAVYRLVIQEMIRNQPATALERHTHLRDCLVAMILFQTYLRIKNIAQLTYSKDQSGQLRRVGKSWFVRIHRSRFKNAGGAYFKHGHYFNLRLRDEDGLYSMIESYLKLSRPYLRSLKPKPCEADRIAGAGVPEVEGALREELPEDEGGENAGGEDVGGEDASIAGTSDDEDGDSFEDADGDGEPDEARFFVKPGGGQYLPSQMAARYKHITNRYFSESPDRDRGLKGLMPHGPHAVRHVGATDALAREGSWEAAARVIQDSIRAVQECYVLFSPDRQGEMAGETMERGRSAKPNLPDGVFLLNRTARPQSSAA